MSYLISIWLFCVLLSIVGVEYCFFGVFFWPSGSSWFVWMAWHRSIFASGYECMVVAGFVVQDWFFVHMGKSASLNDLWGVLCWNVDHPLVKKNSCCLFQGGNRIRVIIFPQEYFSIIFSWRHNIPKYIGSSPWLLS